MQNEEHIERLVRGHHSELLGFYRCINLGDLLKDPFIMVLKPPSNSTKFISKLLHNFTLRSIETKKGNLLESIYQLFSKKSAVPGVDSEIETNEFKFLIQNKSSAKWGNKQSREGQKKQIIEAKQMDHNSTFVMSHFSSNKETTRKTNVGDVEISGQNSWYLSTGDKNFHEKLLHKMYIVSQEYASQYENVIKYTEERLIAEFDDKYPGDIKDSILQISKNLISNWTPHDIVNTMVDPQYVPPKRTKIKKEYELDII